MLFQASADTIADRLRNLGFPYAEVLRNYDVDAAALKAEATLEAVPGSRAWIGQVLITGLEQVDTGTVRKMLSVHPHDLFRQDRLYQSQRDLYGMGVFRSVNVVLADSVPRPGDSTVTVVVRVAEGPRHRVRFGVGYGSLDCIRVQSGWTAYDFLGGARALDLTARVSKLGVGSPTDAGLRRNVCHFLHDDVTSDTINYNVGLTLRQPAFFSPRHTASLGVFAERRSEFKAYTRQAVGGNAVVTLNARRNVPVTLGYGISVGRTTADPAVYCSVFRVCDETDRGLLARSRRFGAVTVSGACVAARRLGHAVRVQSRSVRAVVLLPARPPWRAGVARARGDDRVGATDRPGGPERTFHSARPALLRRRPEFGPRLRPQ